MSTVLLKLFGLVPLVARMKDLIDSRVLHHAELRRARASSPLNTN